MDSQQENSDGAAVSVMALRTSHVRTGPRFRLPHQFIGYLFIMPAILFLLVVVAYPLFLTLKTSFEEIVVRQKITTFVGLQNYANVLKDSVFWQSLKNTLIYTVGSMVLHLAVGGFFAILLNEKW